MSVRAERRQPSPLRFGAVQGRYAPSPTGSLHVGNLRTAMLAWLFARAAGSGFVLRVDDLDPADARPEHEAGQLADLRAIGVDWDGPIMRQSERRAAHDDAIATLVAAGRTYECWCTRREIREAAAAPHLPTGAYPGTCRGRRDAGGGRPAALRLDAGGEVVTVVDRLHGEVGLAVDDLVLRRNDGVPAYNLAVVVDDAAQGVEEVVRGDDLLDSTPRQVLLARLLGLPVPAYAHVPLVLGPDGARLAKRHGAVALADLGDADAVRSTLAAGLGLATPGERVTMAQLLTRFDPAALPTQPWVWTAPTVS
jgi:glutamyl-tRNA synthetase